MASALIVGRHARALICPKCKGSKIHQERFDVVMRDVEDGDGTRTVCGRGAPTVTRVAAADITETRRDVTRISFTCEDCSIGESIPAYPWALVPSAHHSLLHADGGDAPPKMVTLMFVQHKGDTLVSWE